VRTAALLALIVGLWAGPALAQGTPREAQIVVWPLVTNGLEYRRVAHPQQVDTVRVLADTPVVFEARRAEVYFWPLTREYLADFGAQQEPLVGSLEIVSPGGEVRRIAPRRYTTWYPEGVSAGRSELLFDELADAAHSSYQREARQAAEAAQAFEQRRAEHYARAQAWLQQAAARAQPLPPPPPEFTEQEPPPYRAYASAIAESPVVSLPAGEYRLRWRGPEGALIAGSERRLVSFGPRRQAVGYRILPESRWTQAEASFDPGEAVYLRGDGALFLQPIAVEEYNANLYARLHRPQTLEAPDPSVHLWVPRGPVVGAQLSVLGPAGRQAPIAARPYRVAQQAGTAFGYRVEPFEASSSPLQPDFVAMRLPSEAGPLSRLSLIEPSGAEVANSQREIRPIRSTPEPLLYAPALIPLLVATVLRLRRHTTRRARRAQPTPPAAHATF
jgi:hypothetical protein